MASDHSRKRAHESGGGDENVFQLRKPLAIATKPDGEVWEIYANVEDVMNGGMSLWAVRRGAHPQRLDFVDFVLTPEGREEFKHWAALECLKRDEGESGVRRRL